jgi:hypothetical protein
MRTSNKIQEHGIFISNSRWRLLDLEIFKLLVLFNATIR